MKHPQVSRRQFLAGLGLTAAGAAAGGSGALGPLSPASSTPSNNTVPFYGTHQAGIVTDQQDRLYFAAFDVIGSDRRELHRVLREWTQAAAQMTQGRPAGDVGSNPNSPPQDTGEAVDLMAANLTLTIGYGRSLFEKDGTDRFGIRKQLPDALIDLPTFGGDRIDPARSGGDICIQACADDPQVAFHAVRNLARIGRGVVVMRWNQLGFGRTATTSRDQSTPRNLMGSMDGTNNVRSQDDTLLRDHVWVPSSDGPSWMTNGSYLVARRIRMLIEVWDRSSLAEQEQTIGRHKDSGAPLGKKNEKDAVDLNAVGPDGPVIPQDAHIRLASPENNGGKRLLRRGYSFTDGMDELGQLDAGLFFLAYQRDIRQQFLPIQQQLGANDRLNEYIEHTSSATFAIQPGVAQGGSWGDGLFS